MGWHFHRSAPMILLLGAASGFGNSRKRRKILIMPKSTLLLLFSLVLTACATSPQNNDEVVNADVAIIKGRSENILKEILVPIGTKVNINFRKIDDKNMFNAWSGAPTQIELKPGHHTLEIGCFGKHDTIQFFGTSLVSIDVKGGEVYQSRPTFDTPRTCSVELVRVGGNSTANDEMKPAPVKKAGDQARVYFLRANPDLLSFMFSDMGAEIQIDDTTRGRLMKGRYVAVAISPGRHRINAVRLDVVGQCELQLTAQAGNEYYFDVLPSSDITSFAAAGADANVIEGDVKKCEGAFTLQLLGEGQAKNMISTLRPE
jgi:hypothetical protein